MVFGCGCSWLAYFAPALRSVGRRLMTRYLYLIARSYSRRLAHQFFVTDRNCGSYERTDCAGWTRYGKAALLTGSFHPHISRPDPHKVVP